MALAVLLSCSGAGGSQAGTGEVWAVERSYASGEAEVLLRLDRTQITTAEWVLLQVEVLAAEGRTVQLPTAEQAGAGELQVTQTRSAPPALEEGGLVRWVRWVRWFELQPFLAGEYQVPGLVVAVARRDGEPADLVHTEPILLTVTSVLAGAGEAAALQDVAEPVAVPPRVGRLLLLAALGVLAAGVIAASVVLLRRRAARTASRAAIVPPHEAALRALRELASGDLLQRDLLAFHTAVAAIVRRYLEQRFGVRAPERTTEELMSILAGGGWLDDPQRRALHAFLAQCDRVKFARARPTATASQGLLDTATTLVTATRPPDQEPETAPETEAARAV